VLPAVIWRPLDDFTPGKLCPLFPLVTLLDKGLALSQCNRCSCNGPRAQAHERGCSRQGLLEEGTRATLYPGPVGTGAGKVKVRMIRFSVIKSKIISVSQLPVFFSHNIAYLS